MNYKILEKLSTRLGLASCLLLVMGFVVMLIALALPLYFLIILFIVLLAAGGLTLCFWWGMNYADVKIHKDQKEAK